MAPVDILVVEIGSTGGWRTAVRELIGSLRRGGATVELASARPAPRVRTFALTDLVEARLAREAAQRGIAAHDPRAIIYCSSTAALLWPAPGAIYLDSIAAENRPGHHGIWQRPVERRRLRQAPLLLPWSPRSLDRRHGDHAPAVIAPPPVRPPSGLPCAPRRPRAAVTYAGDPVKRRLGLVLEAWSRARRGGETLTVAGTETIEAYPGVEVAGRLAPEAFRELLSSARAFIAAPHREDFGIAALEALAHGCQLVTTPSPGPYPALALARELDPRLVSDGLAPAIRTALDDPRSGYGARALELLAPYKPSTVDERVAREVLPRLLGR